MYVPSYTGQVSCNASAEVHHLLAKCVAGSLADRGGIGLSGVQA